jgi:hypothetical protein
MEKLRRAHGEQHHKTKLTEEDVYAIRDSRLPNGHLAQKYGVSSPAISCIKARRTWAHLPERITPNAGLWPSPKRTAHRG